jgi:hypothetical protein
MNKTNTSIWHVQYYSTGNQPLGSFKVVFLLLCIWHISPPEARRGLDSLVGILQEFVGEDTQLLRNMTGKEREDLLVEARARALACFEATVYLLPRILVKLPDLLPLVLLQIYRGDPQGIRGRRYTVASKHDR